MQKSICNHIRYAADKEDKYQYHTELGNKYRKGHLVTCFLEDQIRQRQHLAELERENDLNISRQLVGSLFPESKQR